MLIVLARLLWIALVILLKLAQVLVAVPCTAYMRLCRHFGSSCLATEPSSQTSLLFGTRYPTCLFRWATTAFVVNSPIPLFEMANLTSVEQLYTQADFLPESVIGAWAEAGNTLGFIFDWLQIPQTLTNAVMTVVGGSVNDHLSVIAHTTVAEWESLIAPADLMGQSVTLALRSKLRQVLISARIVMRINVPPPMPTQQSQVVQNQAASMAVASGLETMQTVDITDVLIQAPDSIRVPIMSDEEFQEGIDEYERVEGKEPDDDERPTIEQASAFTAWVRTKKRIYADLAVLVPHGERALMRRHLRRPPRYSRLYRRRRRHRFHHSPRAAPFQRCRRI